MDLNDIQLKLHEKLKPSGWADKLKMFILSKEFADILKFLYEESKAGKRFTPTLKDIFRAFEECPYNDLKIVMVGQDPYPQAGVADGIAFSCSHTEKVQPSLRYIFTELENTVYPDGYRWDTDLKRWSNQGVLMLNTAFTCEVGNIGSHINLWKPFTTYLFETLNDSDTGLIYAFLGNKAKEWHKMISTDNYKIFTTHPASAAYSGGKWRANDLFGKLNTLAEEQYKTKIIW